MNRIQAKPQLALALVQFCASSSTTLFAVHLSFLCIVIAKMPPLFFILTLVVTNVLEIFVVSKFLILGQQSKDVGRSFLLSTIGFCVFYTLLFYLITSSLAGNTLLISLTIIVLSVFRSISDVLYTLFRTDLTQDAKTRNSTFASVQVSANLGDVSGLLVPALFMSGIIGARGLLVYAVIFSAILILCSMKVASMRKAIGTTSDKGKKIYRSIADYLRAIFFDWRELAVFFLAYGGCLTAIRVVGGIIPYMIAYFALDRWAMLEFLLIYLAAAVALAPVFYILIGRFGRQLTFSFSCYAGLAVIAVTNTNALGFSLNQSLVLFSIFASFIVNGLTMTAGGLMADEIDQKRRRLGEGASLLIASLSTILSRVSQWMAIVSISIIYGIYGFNIEVQLTGSLSINSTSLISSVLIALLCMSLYFMNKLAQLKQTNQQSTVLNKA